MKKPFNLQALQSLIALRGKPAVSIYIPTSRILTRVQAESLQLNNLLKVTGKQLGERGFDDATIQEVLAPAQALVKNADFWHQQRDGLALFLSKETFLTYQVPITFNTEIVVADNFYVKPLLPLFTKDRFFYLLTISPSRIRLLRGSRYALDELDIEELDTEAISAQFSKTLHAQTSHDQPLLCAHAAAPNGEMLPVIDPSAIDNDELKRLFQQIDHQLSGFLHDQNVPLIIAGSKEILSIYQAVNTHPHLVELYSRTDLDNLHSEDLQKKAWMLAAPIFAAEQSRKMAEYHHLENSGRTEVDLHHLLPAADQGRIETAFIAAHKPVWGTYDATQQQVTLHEESNSCACDLTDLLAMYTLLHNGDIYVVEPKEMRMRMSVEARAAAILRS
jgi:hypothetical protein